MSRIRIMPRKPDSPNELRRRLGRGHSIGGPAASSRRPRVVAIAEEMRRLHPRAEGALSANLTTLFNEAVERYRAQCLWNIQPRATIDGLRTIAKRLKKHGGMAAWRLATRIEQSVDNAAR